MSGIKDYIISTVAGILLVLMIILFFLYYHDPKITALNYVGFIIWVIAAIFGVLPIFVLKKKGGVEKGDSYMKTTNLVDTNIYSIVRHPQYVASPLMSIALILMGQHIILLALGIPVIVMNYFDMYCADKRMIERFGKEYLDYMERVPRSNFLLGLYRKYGKNLNK